jgi:cytochrome c553
MKAISRLAVVFAACSTSALFAADAAANWKEHCAKCHGSDGRGDTKMGHKLLISDLTDAKLQAKFTDADAAGAIKSGLKDAKGKTIMKPVRGLSDDEVNALVTHVRGLKK